MRWIPAFHYSTHLRLTARLLLVLGLSVLTSFSVAYTIIRGALESELQGQLEQTVESYRLSAQRGELEERLLAEVPLTNPGQLLIAYQPAQGEFRGNVAPFPLFEGARFLSATELEPVPSEQLADEYQAFGLRLNGALLVVGQNQEALAELGEIFVNVFLISWLPTLLLASIFGLWSARSVRARVESIQQILQRIAAGDLAARVEPSGQSPDDLSQIAEAVNQMAQAQAASVTALRQVSADIAHDLKTPIQRISVRLRQLEEGQHLPPEDFDQLLQQTKQETQQIVQTFESLLRIAQIEGGRPRQHFARVELDQVARNVVDVYQPTAEESGHLLQLQLGGAGPFTVHGEKNLLGQILANLIENAIRHTPERSAIRVGLSQRGPQLEMVVSDNGPGIPAEERENVLRRLYRLDRSRSTPGSGLGLSLVAAICDLHGAKLQLTDNAPGLAVRISFPMLD